jgi:putative spermidine/putrescine transport system substrate-binding protein
MNRQGVKRGLGFDQHINSQIRREKMKKIVALLFLVFFALPSGLLAENQVVICDWGGAIQKAQKEAYYEPFEKETGIRVIAVSWPNIAKIRTMVETGNVEWDIVTSGGAAYYTSVVKNMAEKIDYSYFDPKVLDQLYPQAKQPYGVAAYSYSYVFTWRTDVYSKENCPKNTAEFWDVKKFPGPRTMFDISAAALGCEWPLLADGAPMDQLYNNPDMDIVFKKLDEIKPHVVKWWKSGAVPGQLFTDKEIVLGLAYNGRMQKLKEEGGKIDYHWNEGRMSFDRYFVPKGAPNKENAMKFIAFASRPDRQAAFAKIIAYGPVNQKAFDMIPQERAQLLPSYPENMKKQFIPDDNWFMDPKNVDGVIERWTNWITK